MYIQWERWNIGRKIRVHQREELLLQCPLSKRRGWNWFTDGGVALSRSADSTFIAKEETANIPRCSQGVDVIEWAGVWSLIASYFSVKCKLSSSTESEDDERGVKDFRREEKL